MDASELLARYEARGDERVFVAFLARHLEEILRVARVVLDAVEHVHDAFEQLLFLAEPLGVLRVVPDVRVFEFPVDFD